MTKQMDRVHTITLMVLLIKVNGERISNMALEEKVGLMAQYMKVNI